MNNNSNENKGKKIYFAIFLVIFIFLSIVFVYLFLSNSQKPENNKKSIIPGEAIYKAPKMASSTSNDECANMIENSYSLSLAFGDYEAICSNENSRLSKLCIDSLNSSGSNTSVISQKNEPPSQRVLCDMMCEIIKKSKIDNEYFENIVVSGSYITSYEDEKPVYKKINVNEYVLKYGLTSFSVPAQWRIGVIYRVNKNRLNDVCGMYGDYGKDLCLKNLETRNNYLIEVENKCSRYIKDKN